MAALCQVQKHYDTHRTSPWQRQTVIIAEGNIKNSIFCGFLDFPYIVYIFQNKIKKNKKQYFVFGPICGQQTSMSMWATDIFIRIPQTQGSVKLEPFFPTFLGMLGTF